MTKEDTNFLSEIESSSKTKQRELSLSLIKEGLNLQKNIKKTVIILKVKTLKKKNLQSHVVGIQIVLSLSMISGRLIRRKNLQEIHLLR